MITKAVIEWCPIRKDHLWHCSTENGLFRHGRAGSFDEALSKLEDASNAEFDIRIANGRLGIE